MTIAIHNAKAEHAHQFHETGIRTQRSKRTLKRLWWSCIIRDRILSLVFSRPLQALGEIFDTNRPLLNVGDMEKEFFQSDVYEPHVKDALCHITISLCRLAVAMTNVLCLTNSPPGQQICGPSRKTSASMKWQVDEAERSLATWKISTPFKSDLGGKPRYHPSLIYFQGLLKMYYTYVMSFSKVKTLFSHQAEDQLAYPYTATPTTDLMSLSSLGVLHLPINDGRNTDTRR